MNSVEGHISDIQISGGLSLVSVTINAQLTLKTIIIETPDSAPYLKINHPIKVLFKETEVVIGTDERHAISLQNRISGKIKSIEKGKLISRITLNTEVGMITAVISTSAIEQLQLKEGVQALAMIKLNETMLSE